ncbi:MAG: hypothetical protein ACRC9X_07365 [Bacteroidales bacterium]
MNTPIEPHIIFGSCLLFFGILYALRALALWYWKVTDMLKNQQKQTELLEKIYVQLGGKLEELESEPEETSEI